MRSMNTKARIIRKQGNDVQVTRYLGEIAVMKETKALIGRMTKAVTNMRQLESYREGIFLPDFDVDSGDFVYNTAQNENYVVSSVYPEPFKNKTISLVVIMLKCNHLLTIKALKNVADERGNLKKELVAIFDGLPCYVEQVTNELRQIDAGIHPDTEYLVYTSGIAVKETDQVSLQIRGAADKFKVMALDYVTFPNMLVMQVSRDVRKG